MRQRTITSLEEHPNLAEIVGILAQLPHIVDADVPRLAEAWHNSAVAGAARARALAPDAPLVLDVLAAFDAVQSLFSDDVAGGHDYVTVDPSVVTVALKTIRDAIAAAYARPALPRRDYRVLMRAWRAVYPVPSFDEPDLGPHAERVKAVLAILPRLADRCHDERAAALFEALTRIEWSLDEQLRSQARDETWRAAVITCRRRVWGLVRRSGAEGLARFCTRCRREPGGGEERRVLELCLDAACALIVADAVDETLVDVLTLPLADLIPAPRGSLE